MSKVATVADVLAGRARFAIDHADALAFARSLPDASIDALVTDPPAGIGFMGKTWDKPGKMGTSGGVAMPSLANRNPSCRSCGGRKRAGPATKACGCEIPDWNESEHRTRDREMFVGFMREILAECHRAMKPGAHALVWALPRTSHWTATAVEDAGFEVRDVVVHLFGTGFPKSLDVSKALDKSAGIWRGRAGAVTIADQPSKGTEYERTEKGGPITAAAAGFGTALKPASEHWILARKPLDGTVARNFSNHGTGAINVDACRIAGLARSPGSIREKRSPAPNVDGREVPVGTVDAPDPHPAGRWPANVVLSHDSECRYLHDGADPEVVCTPGCAVAALDAQSGLSSDSAHARGLGLGYGGGKGSDVVGRGFNDTGGASRFFFCAKPSTAERESGLGHRKRVKPAVIQGRAEGSPGTINARSGMGNNPRANIHPTVKSIALMRWLCRLVTPPGGVVLDVFAGSGTTAVACSQEGLRFVGCEREAEYVEIARDRLLGDAPLLNAGGGK